MDAHLVSGSDDQELRRRQLLEGTAARRDDHSPGIDSKQQSDEETDGLVSEDDKVEALTRRLPQASDKTAEAIDKILIGLSPRWRNWVVRTIFTVLMVSTFACILFTGPLCLVLLVLAIQIKCFKEIIDIGYAVYRVHKLPWFRTLSWFFLLTSEYWFLGESLIDYFRVLLRKTDFLPFLVKYHRLFSFALYVIGIVWFVLSLKKSYYLRQFSLFAWTHCTLLIVVGQSYFIIQNIFQGTIWFLVPVSAIVCNDIFAYIFGFFFGKTPLIKISPKKTWEGFMGGAFSTIIFSICLSYFLLHHPRMICPIEFYDDNSSFMDCEIASTFQLQPYDLPKPLAILCKVVCDVGAPYMLVVFHLTSLQLRLPPSIHAYPFLFHAFVLAVFASVVGPFGGFFASGFKRAFKIKDFGDIIPGHGGLMDRFDCQLLMGTFTYVYISSFIRLPDPSKLLRQIFWLRPDEQLIIFAKLKEQLIDNGLIPNQ